MDFYKILMLAQLITFGCQCKNITKTPTRKVANLRSPSSSPIVLNNLVEPFGIHSTEPFNEILIADFRESNRIVKINLSDFSTSFLVNGGFVDYLPAQEPSADAGRFNMPHSISQFKDGTFVVTEFGNQRL